MLPPFVKLYKALFDRKHLEKELNRRGEIFGALFSKESALFHKKYPFFKVLFFFIKSALSGQYQILP